MPKVLSEEEVIKRFNDVHGNKYDYSKVKYVNNRTKVVICCPKHGEFLQTPDAHFQGCGCPKCGIEKSHVIMTNDEWINKAEKVHSKKYDYSKVEYKSPSSYVTIICPKHGEYKQKASYHLSGNGCPMCGVERVKNGLSLTFDEFVVKAKEIHGDKYDYSKVEYVNNKTPVSIICKNHGEFIVRPDNHLYNRSGCPKCYSSKLEESIQRTLNESGIMFEVQKRFDWLKNDTTNYPMRYDIYIPSKNVAIECQGQQHFVSCGMFSESGLSEIVHRDEVKNRLSNENGIKLFYFTEGYFKDLLGISKIYSDRNTFFNIDDLLAEIL